MNLFRRQNNLNDIPPELRPYYGTVSGSSLRRLNYRAILSGLLVVVVIGGLLIWSPWSSSSKPTHKISSSTSQKSHNNTTNNSKSNNFPSVSNPTPLTNLPTDTTTDQTPQASTPSTASTGTIVNTGPGQDEILLFIAVVVLSFVGYEMILRKHSRRQNQI
jgi:amino acid transporter